MTNVQKDCSFPRVHRSRYGSGKRHDRTTSEITIHTLIKGKRDGSSTSPQGGGSGRGDCVREFCYGPGIARERRQGKDSRDAKEAFAKLKTLKGTWNNKSRGAGKGHDDGDSKVIYRLTGAGSALVETDFPDSGHEMVSVYHLDGDDLRLTHYCAAGNQPRLKLDRASSTPDKLMFVFDGGTNLDPAKDMHIHGMTMTFEKEGEVKSAWEANAGGKKVGGATVFHLSKSAH